MIKRQGLDQFVQTIMQQGEARLAELITEQTTAWEEIGAAHGIDLKAVDYNFEGDSLIPMRMKL